VVSPDRERGTPPWVLGRLPAALICAGLLVLLLGWRLLDLRWSSAVGILLIASGVATDLYTRRRRVRVRRGR
jgi:hypothetical protein